MWLMPSPTVPLFIRPIGISSACTTVIITTSEHSEWLMGPLHVNEISNDDLSH